MLLLATDPRLPIRFMAVIGLIVVTATFMYVLRHLKKIAFSHPELDS
jgi:hypothetical protein